MDAGMTFDPAAIAPMVAVILGSGFLGAILTFLVSLRKQKHVELVDAVTLSNQITQQVQKNLRAELDRLQKENNNLHIQVTKLEQLVQTLKEEVQIYVTLYGRVPEDVEVP